MTVKSISYFPCYEPGCPISHDGFLSGDVGNARLPPPNPLPFLPGEGSQDSSFQDQTVVDDSFERSQ
jgi:hypothetical protein